MENARRQTRFFQKNLQIANVRQITFSKSNLSKTISLELTKRRDLMRTYLLAALSLLILSPAFAQEPLATDGAHIEKTKCDRNKTIEKNVTVVSTADGDTINIKARSGVYAVRMIGMDTPETHYFGHNQGKWGDVAADRLAEILPAGTKIRLEFSPSVCDSYGRVLAHIFKGEMHVNKVMVKEGLAVNYCMYPSVAYCEEIGQLAKNAIKKRLGMFVDSNVELPYDFRRRISKRHQSSYVGSLITKEVYRPGQQDRTPVSERIFFSNESSVKAPFHVVD
jgi:endonuclease YncB( thermonuclease family)